MPSINGKTKGLTSFDTTILFNEEEIEVEVEITSFDKGYPPSREDPGSGPEAEYTVWMSDIDNKTRSKIDITDKLTEYQYDELHERCIKEMEKEPNDEPDYDEDFWIEKNIDAAKEEEWFREHPDV